MLTLAYPWLLLFIAAPLLMRWLARPHQESRQGLQVPFLQRLARLSGRKPTHGAIVLRGSWLQQSVLIVCWCALVLALARPQLVEEPITKTLPGRDLLLAVDLSGSMETEDFTDAGGNRIDRVSAVKQVLDEFLARREGDRVGLIFFGNAAFVQVPFTEDLQVCRVLLQEAQPRMAGPQTMLGDAIGKAISVFERSELKEKVLILLTDGNDTGSLVPPVKAAEIARDKGIVIHVIGMGDPTTVGEEKLDDETLKAIAATTGGKSFNAIDRAQLEAVYSEIDAITTHQVETLSYRPVHDLYYWPLLLAIGLSLLYHAAMACRRWLQRRRERNATGSTVFPSATLAILPFGTMPFTPVNLGGLQLLRVELLWLLLPAALLIWLIASQRDQRQQWRQIIAPPLLDALLINTAAQRRLRPWQLLAVIWLIGIIALAGPAWQREPSPFSEDQAALVIALKVTPSMQTADLPPSRLQRSVHKIHDLLAQRAGARTALIAYAGSAHLVMPLTRDAGIIELFAGELRPAIMPRQGGDPGAALELAQKQLAEAGQPGSILFISDGITREQATGMNQRRQTGAAAVVILGAIGLAGDSAERRELEQAAQTLNAPLVFIAPDERDINALRSHIEHSLTAVAEAEGGERWRDAGYWLLPLLCVLALLWFRPGWVVSWQ
jgi:Mg-chelatase subunit ChlD